MDFITSYTPDQLRRMADAIEAREAGLPVYIVAGDKRVLCNSGFILGCRYEIETPRDPNPLIKP